MTIFRACHHQTFDCPVGGWVIEQRAIILSPTVRSPTVFLWFPCISGQTIHGIDINLGGYIHNDTPETQLTFGHVPLNFCRFMASDCSSSFHAFAAKPLMGLGSDLVGQLIAGPPQAWSTFGHAPLNFPCFLTTD